MNCMLFFLLIGLCLSGVRCWDQEELDLFDLVEEIGEETIFYDILGVNQVPLTIHSPL